MRFGPVPLHQAEGAVLAHSLSLPDGRLRKGIVLGHAELRRLRAAGLDEVTAARLEAGDVMEDVAAARLASAMVPDPVGAGLRVAPASTGRVNIFADTLGVAEIRADRINAINALHPMITVATVPEWQRMALRGMVATVKIIAYAVPGAALEQACASIGPAGCLAMRPTRRGRVALIQTLVGKTDGAKGRKAVETRLVRLGAALTAEAEVRHDQAALAEALEGVLGGGAVDAVLILTGSATSDPDDIAPAAVRQVGGQIMRFGMPVDPGNLLFLGDVAGVPVIGLPGCARSPALNGADWVLERTLCDVPVSANDIAGMGVGGLLMEIPTRPQPRDPT
ncbi:molybdopterin biosynthesis protein [Pseudooceanicola sediminis]|uniref:Molybdopterin biosynthesis protein n=1 Tax=Pseudooceanicola sediminis TaxID=2211117 RepID=A0A399IYI1_9RHOB|nr:molybdopterin-binding protein [Pseudooceanicola sediminis]KAA2316128.1 molybdopterin-binding protein [Puniceibacterium sp. HSS470]RII38238.1 molybdopterin biosynthesis protein [Pseudooceanicola sediminis]|tara:strand:+ start:555 stop:1565 length:1011 start_codon:yes stop_codon:yes gene_type:complete